MCTRRRCRRGWCRERLQLPLPVSAVACAVHTPPATKRAPPQEVLAITCASAPDRVRCCWSSGQWRVVQRNDTATEPALARLVVSNACPLTYIQQAEVQSSSRLVFAASCKATGIPQRPPPRRPPPRCRRWLGLSSRGLDVELALAANAESGKTESVDTGRERLQSRRIGIVTTTVAVTIVHSELCPNVLDGVKQFLDVITNALNLVGKRMHVSA